jgi:ribonuclease HII
MGWLVGIDEAGYGPNLGPFVMTAVACRTAGEAGDLWQRLAPAVRRAGDPPDHRLLVADSKDIYSSGRGLAGLERGVRVLISTLPATLSGLVDHLCPDAGDDLVAEAWYTGTSEVPATSDLDDLDTLHSAFTGACGACGVGDWRARSVVVCPPRFNALIDRHDSKGAVLGQGFIQLLEWAVAATDGDLDVFVDKQGGRNCYAAQVQQAVPGGLTVAVEESAGRSRYRVAGLPRQLRVCFEPRADANHFCVALASMVSKYLRERFMAEFNAFWCKHVPDLKPTAGYPGDAARFLKAIRPALATLQIREEVIWRQR